MLNGPLSLATIQLPKITACLYGKAGVGKTVFACNSQSTRTFVFDIDDGTFSAKAWRGDPATWTPGTRQDLVDVWPRIKTRKEFEAAFGWFLQNHRRYGRVVLDTATELQNLFLQEIAEKAGHQIPAMQDWGVGLLVMEHLARVMRGLPLDVIWNCHEIIAEEATSRRLMFRPSFKGQFKESYAKHFDLIGRLCLVDHQVKAPDGTVHFTPQRFLQCRPNQYIEAKDRSNSLTEMEPPILDYVFGKMIHATTWVAAPESLSTPAPALRA